ncbi:Panacea domain-containing protein [Candidatus Stoquefichus massiliensis]|uniref:Panacea domain-containing protein n=1 Tax=Candidatus Stoquefichus massiliensis TaxID=1470350 RepID=UPI00048330DD|nr:type II toxin-antitoxin system antitoxin SocA domain-containing protein [Candidatus Stoquefichus massiliensis]
MINVIEIAKYILSKCSQDNEPISNLQLQKILFFIQKDRLKHAGWFIREDFEAWPYGPVIPQLYNIFCSYGAMPIDREYDNNLDEKIKLDINETIERLRVMDPWVLVEKTHSLGGAWDQVYNNGSGYKKIIPKELIRERG